MARALDAIVRMSSTRFNYWLELVIDLVLGLALLTIGIIRHIDQPFRALFTVMIGLLLFSLIEYVFHRWIFHSGVPLFEQGHDAHHQRPLGYDSLPFFLPPVVLLLLTGLFSLAMPVSYAMLLGGAMSLGYVAYGLSHFIIHHRRFRTPWLKHWAARHHIHHHHPEANFGVTSQLWDVLFKTSYVQRHRHS